jgi:hypothetical protein
VIDHGAIHLAARALARTLAVCTTGSTTLEATAAGYTRASGSFLTDGFAVGMEVTPTGFTQTAVGTITAVTALTMSINGGRTVQSSGSGRTLAVGFPSRVQYENRRLVPDAGHPYVAEEYLPGGGPSKETLGAFGELEVRPTYVLRLHAPPDSGLSALRGYTDALTTLFAPGTPITVGSDTARVRTDVGPFASPIQQTEDGWAVSVLSIPLRLRTSNSR